MSAQELLFLLVAIFVIWIFLKLAKVAIKVIVFFITIAVVLGVLWIVFHEVIR